MTKPLTKGGEMKRYEHDTWNEEMREDVEGDYVLWSDCERLIQNLEKKVDYHRQHYSLDLFPNSYQITEESSRDSVSAKMGRHMCDWFREYIDQALKELESE